MGAELQAIAAETRALDASINMPRAVNAPSLCEGDAMRGAGLTESRFGVLEVLHHLGKAPL